MSFSDTPPAGKIQKGAFLPVNIQRRMVIRLVRFPERSTSAICPAADPARTSPRSCAPRIQCRPRSESYPNRPHARTAPVMAPAPAQEPTSREPELVPPTITSDAPCVGWNSNCRISMPEKRGVVVPERRDIVAGEGRGPKRVRVAMREREERLRENHRFMGGGQGAQSKEGCVLTRDDGAWRRRAQHNSAGALNLKSLQKPQNAFTGCVTASRTAPTYSYLICAPRWRQKRVRAGSVDR